MQKVFRKCAATVVFNKDGLVLLGSRADFNDDNWQFPQGGIEKNESPEDAAIRELFEETSVKSVNVIDIIKHPVRYEFTESIKKTLRKRKIYNDGQDIYFVLLFFNGDYNEINVNTQNPEFKKTCWESLDFAVNNVVEFKKDAYKQMALTFYPKIKEYIKNIS